jgi:hypothetical protein
MIADLEKEKESLHLDRTLASARPDVGPCIQSFIARRRVVAERVANQPDTGTCASGHFLE